MNRVYPIEKKKIKDVRNQMSEDMFAKRNQFLFDFALGIPLRISDIIILQVKDVRDKDVLSITPSKSKRKGKDGVKSKGKKIDYDIHPQLQEKIKEYITNMGDDDYLFPSREKPYMRRETAWSIISKAAKKAGIEVPIGCHSTRKTHARIALDQYKDITFVMQQLGHSSPTSTMHYLHLTDEKRKERVHNLPLYD